MSEQSLTAKSVHGLKWSYASTIVTMVLQIGVTAVLARLLTPAQFGVVAMAGVFLRFGQYFSQMGAGPAVVQRRELSRGDVGTAFTTSLLLGAAFTALFAALAPLAGVLFPDTPGVVSVTRVLSLTFIISGVAATTQALLQRRFAFRAMAVTEIVTYILGYALVGVTLALQGLGMWSLVIASLGQSALVATVYAIMTRRDLRLGMNRRSFREIFSFGGRVSLIGFGEALAGNLDTLWAGHFLGAAATGLYSRATNIAGAPLYSLSSTMFRVLLPGYSSIQSERPRLATTYRATVVVIAGVMIPIAWGLAAASRNVVLVLLGRQWLDAAPVLSILALAVPFSLLTFFGAVLCEATATLNARIVITVLRIGWLAALLVVLAPSGVVGIAVAFALSELLTHAAYLLVVTRLLGIGRRDLQPAYVMGVGAGAVTGGVLLGLQLGLAALGWPAPVALAVQVAAGIACLVLAVTKAGGGEVWREVRWRLVEAGYDGDGKGLAAWVMRRLDALA